MRVTEGKERFSQPVTCPDNTARERAHLIEMVHRRRAVASLEFGILAPVMALFVIGVFDLSKIAILWEQAWNASRNIAESASTMSLPTQVDAPNILTWSQANLALSSVLANIPWLRAGIATGTPSSGSPPAYAVLSSVNYTYETPAQGCTTNCGYVSVVEWSKAYSFTGFNSTSAVLRPCGAPLAQNGLGQNSSANVLAALAELPKNGITVPDPFLVADVTLIYTPYFFSFITGPVTLSATSYVPVRTNTPGATQQWVEFDDTNDPIPAAQCSGGVTE